MQLNYSFFDGTHGPGKYLYQLKQVDLDGSQHFSNLVELHWGVGQMIVYQNYPNPLLIGTPVVPNVASGFNPFGTTPTDFVVPSPATRFTYELPDQDVVSIKIYNSTGKFVANAFTTASGGQPVANLQQPGGTQDAYWDGREQNGSVAPSGAYIYVIESQQSGSFVGKLMLFSN
jgi:hypothetical protein